MKLIDECDVRMWNKANWFGKTMFCITFPLKFVMIGVLFAVCFLFILPMLYLGGTINWIGQFIFLKRVEWKSWKGCVDRV